MKGHYSWLLFFRFYFLWLAFPTVPVQCSLLSGIYTAIPMLCAHTPGVMALMNPHPVEHIPVALVLMGLSGIIEGGSLLVAYRQVKENAAKAGIPFMQYVRAGPDPNDVAVVCADGIYMC